MKAALALWSWPCSLDSLVGGLGLPALAMLPFTAALAHGGLGITTLGICLLVAWQVEDIRVAQINAPYDVGGYTVILRDVSEVQGPNYYSTIATIEMQRDGRTVAMLSPEKRIYPVAQMPTTEAAIANGFLTLPCHFVLRRSFLCN